MMRVKDAAHSSSCSMQKKRWFSAKISFGPHVRRGYMTTVNARKAYIEINVKKLFSLEHSVRALNHTSKTAQIILARTLD